MRASKLAATLSTRRSSSRARLNPFHGLGFNTRPHGGGTLAMATTNAGPGQQQQVADYASLSPAQLVARVYDLEEQLQLANKELRKLRIREDRRGGDPKTAEKRAFDATAYSSRMVALKFAYLGQAYNGLEHHNGTTTVVPAVEAVLWKALVKAKLISPETAADQPENVNWEGADYSKCGRTDRGVSAFGQVVGVRVRSNRPLERRVEREVEQTQNEEGMEVDRRETDTAEKSLEQGQSDGIMLDMPDVDAQSGPITKPPVVTAEFHDIEDEIPYAQILNRILPPDIRVLAWCPVAEDFSARFACRERRYRYFFTQPAFAPAPGAPGLEHGLTIGEGSGKRRDGWLDIEAMKVAAKKYEGLHDFRNFCKLDSSKQIDNFWRRIFVSEIREVTPENEPAAYVAGKDFTEFDASRSETSLASHPPRVYQFVLHGSAFLWHQVRHMVAILFLVGQGLEKPSIIDELLDVETIPCKPHYEMADDAPLVLWDCIFPDPDSGNREDAMPWNWVGQISDESRPRPSGVRGFGKFGNGGIVDDLWQVWRRRKIDEMLAGSLLNIAVQNGDLQVPSLAAGRRGHVTRRVFDGSDAPKGVGVYKPLMTRPRNESIEVLNERYRVRKGLEPKFRPPVDPRGDHHMYEDT